MEYIKIRKQDSGIVPCVKCTQRGSTGRIYPDFDHRKRKINLDFVNDPV